jgi:hypothetical protein
MDNDQLRPVATAPSKAVTRPPKRKRKRTPGKGDRLIKNQASARNGKPKKVFFVAGATSAHLLTGEPDLRSPVGKFIYDTRASYEQHVGRENLTTPLAAIADAAARHALIAALAFGELEGGRVVDAKRIAPAAELYIRATRAHVELLRLLGLHRRVREVKNLHSYLAEQEQAREHNSGN